MKDKILALLAELKGGNYSAFDEFYHLTYRLFYVIGYGILKRKDLTEEALQEAYVSIYKNIDKINLQANVMSYLYTIVKNKSLNVLKKQREDQVAFDETVEMFLGDRNLKPFKDGDLFLEIKKVLNEQTSESRRVRRMHSEVLSPVTKRLLRCLPTSA